ncbi:GNAT family acetyltransferase [Aurantiacibacter gilvus]|uniref:GNAT family acetyltransferase n=1 Tax=Aurantiacibacter gilvus TaxID=3139141 RepID=A0ABU9II80_9SPHN
MRIETYRDTHFDGLDGLWRETFPGDPPRNRAEFAVPAKLAEQPELLFVAVDGEAVIGSIMAGYDGHRGWLYAVAVSPSRQGEGIGRALVEHAEAALRQRGCGKVNLQVREGNPATGFYEQLGYAVEPRTSMGKAI